ncbi:uncharacterized protein LOC122056325 isoform X3 [Zingiber officinale]|uniref:Uncharacterized protein n=1 Tax=Zingiber officinale TaxID=94328 RepID=A0A8J5LJK9_ZINOF|nr:uncharacterized protein LOC122056325 isoform X3 [Zingiber officinale]KAG6518043.1 hypothetical protein ZIOFF_021444 [Zingiber officinale]
MAAVATQLLCSSSFTAAPRMTSIHRGDLSSFWLGSSSKIGLFPPPRDRSVRLLLPPPNASAPARGAEMFDPELRLVFELATDAELVELEHILFGPSFFSPLLKSITRKQEFSFTMDDEYIEEREDFIEHLESRFLYLAADARSTLRGWRPSYKNILLNVKRKLGVRCSSKLSTEDLEVEIFLHLLSEYSSEEIDPVSFPSLDRKLPSNHGSLEVGISKWKVLALGALKGGAKELQNVFVKGCGMLTMARIFQLLARKFSGKLLLEVANYEIKHEIVKKGGQLAAIKLEAKTAELIARQGLARAATRYAGIRSAMMLLGPIMWGTFLADVAIQMLGTDYARILRAIYAFAQIRLTRTNG